MKRTALLLSASILAALPGTVLADPGHGGPAPASTENNPQAPTGHMPSMEGMPKHWQAMMQAMPEECMEAMHEMMQVAMAHGEGATPHSGAAAAAADAVSSIEAVANLGDTRGLVYTANEGGNSLSAIDLAAASVKTVPLPVSPHNVDLTPDGRFLLAVGDPAAEGDHGSDGHGHGEEGAAEGLLVILDPRDVSAPKATVAIGSHPAHVVADQRGRAYAPLAGGDEIAVVDLAQAKVIRRIVTGDYPHGLRLSPDQSELYVANVEDGSVSVIDTGSLTEVARVPVGKAPVQVGFTPAGDQVYVSLRDENRVAVIDTSSREIVGKIDVGPSPIQMIATPDGSYVYVANQGTDAEPNNTVSVIDTATGDVIKTLTTGRGAHGASASADGAFVFVTNIADDSVSIISARDHEVVATVPVDDRPNGIVFASPLN